MLENENVVCSADTGWRVVNSGGRSNNGLSAGAVYWNANNDSSNANANIGSHLSFFNQFRAIPYLLVKHKKWDYCVGSFLSKTQPQQKQNINLFI